MEPASDQMELVTHSFSACAGKAPTFMALTSPSLKISRVGMPRTPYLPGVVVLLSTSILATISLPCMFLASSSTSGAICLHGPHHQNRQIGFQHFGFKTVIGHFNRLGHQVFSHLCDEVHTPEIALNLGGCHRPVKVRRGPIETQVSAWRGPHGSRSARILSHDPDKARAAPPGKPPFV